ncbi:efflux RND transporter periplasmic adaptor subunit [Flavihumibacter sp. ZG627]|uniref:efflux RND transporter periplasmic adaptor subunit n=1 Tax=Flavihumibacter sp. ZG627 TaxID=1463156 RepID=UPI0005807945|nr:efflux RND transporter periplasmic adaptor subunit [Flavihumibacter sp. ZG627]KIC91413.1 hemolysin D [Flavihumibacter sp. ZG627]
MRKIIYFLTLLTVALGCASPQKEEAPMQTEKVVTEVQLSKEQIANAGIETGKPVLSDVSNSLKVNGVVDVPPQNIVSVSFPMGGYLRSTKLLPGMHVNRGEVIGIIEDQSLVQLQQDYLVTKSRLQYLAKDYDRQKMLQENKVNAEKQFQQVSSDYQSAQVMLKGFAEKLRLIGINPESLSDSKLSRSVAIRSPINGYVSKVNVNIGKYVNPTDVLFELINPADIHAALTVFEKDINKVRVGQKVSIRFVDDPERVYEGDVLIFTRNVDENRSGIVHCHFDKMPSNLMPGMFLNATIFLDNVKALTVPEDAVVRFGGKLYVFEAVGNDRFNMLEVEVDSTASNNRLAIQNQQIPLENKTLVTKNAYAVLGKMKNTAEEE